MSKCENLIKHFALHDKFCKDCIHGHLCVWIGTLNDPDEHCQFFKDKSLCVELPCKVGDVVYYIPFGNNIVEYKVAQIVIEPFAGIGMSFHCYGGIAFDMRCIGKTVFLTKEEAEQKLKEMG